MTIKRINPKKWNHPIEVIQTNVQRDVPVTSDTWPDAIRICDKNGTMIGYLRGQFLTGEYEGVMLETLRTVNGSTLWHGLRMEINSSGTPHVSVNYPVAWRSAIGAAASSDRRLKSEIEPLGEDAVKFISELEPVVYTINGERQVGLIAQDVNEADPWDTRMAFETQEGVDGLDEWEKMEDGSPTWKLDYIRIIAPLVATVQKLSDDVKALTERVEELEAQLRSRA